MSPTLDEPVGLASLPVGYAGDERPVRVRIRGEPKNGHTATTPFLS
jgi:glycine cleavage system aminomethyltransferase T